MPVMSYLAYPVDSRLYELRGALKAIPGCDVISAENRELLILVTETADESSETRLQEKLSELQPLQCLALVSAFSDDAVADPHQESLSTHTLPGANS